MDIIQINLAVQDKSLLARWDQFRFGWDIFTAREPLTRCSTDEQRRGWLAALNAAAVATLPANCADRLGF